MTSPCFVTSLRECGPAFASFIFYVPGRKLLLHTVIVLAPMLIADELLDLGIMNGTVRWSCGLGRLNGLFVLLLLAQHLPDCRHVLGDCVALSVLQTLCDGQYWKPITFV